MSWRTAGATAVLTTHSWRTLTLSRALDTGLLNPSALSLNLGEKVGIWQPKMVPHAVLVGLLYTPGMQPELAQVWHAQSLKQSTLS